MASLAWSQEMASTHYDILGLSPTLLDEQPAAAQLPLVKKAYRRALLRNHPDKAAAASLPSTPASSLAVKPASTLNNLASPITGLTLEHPPLGTPSASTASRLPNSNAIPIDRIALAFRTLSTPHLRKAYDLSLHQQARSSAFSALPTQQIFQTGIENVDLDDLDYDDAHSRWSRSCRCGNHQGYAFEEADLEEAADDGFLLVGCVDCSLWLRVHFAVLDEGIEEGNEEDRSTVEARGKPRGETGGEDG